MRFFVSGEFSGFTLNYEENLFGGIQIWAFFGFWSVVHGRVLRRGDHLCVNWGLGEIFGVLSCKWGDLRGEVLGKSGLRDEGRGTHKGSSLRLKPLSTTYWAL
jgi:hypothetical protein